MDRLSAIVIRSLRESTGGSRPTSGSHPGGGRGNGVRSGRDDRDAGAGDARCASATNQGQISEPARARGVGCRRGRRRPPRDDSAENMSKTLPDQRPAQTTPEGRAQAPRRMILHREKLSSVVFEADETNRVSPSSTDKADRSGTPGVWHDLTRDWRLWSKAERTAAIFLLIALAATAALLLITGHVHANT
jgi:hypothetical protein